MSMGTGTFNVAGSLHNLRICLQYLYQELDFHLFKISQTNIPRINLSITEIWTYLLLCIEQIPDK